MDKPIKLAEKYERNGWPSIKRPDLKTPEGWNLSLLTSLERVRSHALSPDGKAIAYIKDGESFSDLYLLPLNGGWPARITTDRPLAPYWDDEILSGPGRQMDRVQHARHVHLVPVREACLKRSRTLPPPQAVRALCPIRADSSSRWNAMR